MSRVERFVTCHDNKIRQYYVKTLLGHYILRHFIPEKKSCLYVYFLQLC